MCATTSKVECTDFHKPVLTYLWQEQLRKVIFKVFLKKKVKLFIGYFFMFIFLMASCRSSDNTGAMASVEIPAFDIEGHRGARGLMPENTIPAMLKALELGVTTLEMDTHISQDGQVLLSHDPYINPDYSLTPQGKEIPDAGRTMYKLYVMDYDEIRRFDVGSKSNERFPQQQKLKTYIPLLSEVMDSVQAKIQRDTLDQVFYNIEIKSNPATDEERHPIPERYIRQVMRVVEEKGLSDWVIIQSFDPRVLNIMRDIYPQIKTSFLVENKEGLAANLQKLNFVPTIYSPHYTLVNPELVEAVQARGMKIIPWTVNEQAEMLRLKQMGVDGLISDYPDLLVSLFGKEKKGF